MSGKAQFIGGQLFWDMLLAYRVCWFMGRYGAGKTSLAVICAARLLAEKKVSTVVSNIPLSFSSSVHGENNADGKPSFKYLENSAILLDESWIYLDTRSSVLEYAGFVRKFNHYLLLPSVFPVHPRLSYFYVQRIFNGYSLGLPMWFYKWNINNKGIKETGNFAVLNPKAVFGHYPTDFVAGDDGGIADTVHATSIIAGYKGTRTETKRKTKGKQDNDEDSEQDDGFSESVEGLEDTVTQMEEAKEDIARLARNIQRARR